MKPRQLWPLALLSAFLLLMGPATFAAEVGEDCTPYYPAGYSAPQPGEREKIGASLKGKLNSSEIIPVIIILKSQPMETIVEEVQAEYESEFEDIDNKIRQINLKYQIDDRGLTHEQLAQAMAQQALSISKADRQAIDLLNQRSKLMTDAMRSQVMQRAEQAVAFEQSLVRQFVLEKLGSVTYTYTIVNSIAAQVSGKAIREISEHPLVERVIEDKLMEAHLNLAGPALFVNTFWNAGVTGGVYWNATLDTGVDTSHPNLSSKTWWQGVFHDTAKNQAIYDDDSTSTDDLQGHGTHVAGIMNSDHATYRGIAFGSTRSTNLKGGFRRTNGNGSMFDSDARAAVHWGHTNATVDVINYSFGSSDPMVDDDDDMIKFWDGYVHGTSTTMTKSAGNSGSGAKTLTSPAGTWNGIVVANVNMNGTTARDNDTVNAGSSRGPTPAERKKPDIAAPGTSIMAPNHNWEGANPDFVSKTGTSMAAPMVGGAATLLRSQGISNPRAIKAVLINTADFMQGNTTWDAAWGWGYMNLERAYLRRFNYFVTSVTPRNTTGEYRLYRVPNPAVGDKATMVWHRRVNYNNTSIPTVVNNLSDLNLRFYRESNGAAHDSSLSPRDNVEQVVSSTTDPLVIRAYAWSTSFAGGATSEQFALAVPPGTVSVNGPNINGNAGSSNYTPPLNAKFPILVRVNNTGDLPAHGCTISFSLPAGVSLVSGSLSNNVGTVAANGSSSYVEIWLRATTSGTKTINLSVSSSSYGIDYSGGGSFTINPGAADNIAPYSVLNLGGNVYRSSGTELIANGGFESNFSGWITSGTTAIETSNPASGSRNARLGSGSGNIYQTVTISNSASRATLSFDYQASASFLASVGCSVQDTSGNILVYPLLQSSSTLLGWNHRSIDLTRFVGQTIRVNFHSSEGIFGGSSTLWLDNVSLKEDETVWTSSSSLPIISRDDRAGIDYQSYRIGSGSWITGDSIPLTDDGGYTLSYRAFDNSGNADPIINTVVYKDTTAPVSALRVGTPRVVSGGVERVTNGGFESAFSGWTTTGTVTQVSDIRRSGSFSARINNGVLFRDVFVSGSASRAFVSAWVRTQSGSGLLANYSASIQDPDTGLIVDSAVSGNTTNLSWTQVVWDVSKFKGRTVRIRFSTGTLSGTAPTMWVDDVSLRESATVHVTTSTQMRIVSAENVGVNVYQHRIGGGSLIEGQTFFMSGSGAVNAGYRARDFLGYQESEITTQFTIDTTGPTGSLSINNNAQFTTSLNVTLNISAFDPAGVESMRFRNSGGAWSAWVPWNDTHPWTLPAGEGTKIVQMQLRDNLGNLSGEYSDSIIYLDADSADTIGEVKLFGPHPLAISLASKVVSGDSRAGLYIQEADRSSGIRLNRGTLSLPTFTPGQRINVSGILQLGAGSEPEIYLTSYSSAGSTAAPRPLGMMNSKLGGEPYGDYIPGVFGGVGIHNTGLLVKSWGKVLAVDAVNNRIEITDGSLMFGQRLFVDYNAVTLAYPTLGQFRIFTGNLGTVEVSGSLHPIIRPRNNSDVANP